MKPLPYRSVPAMLKARAQEFADCDAISYKKDGRYVVLSYRRLLERVMMAARGLRKVGVSPGDKIAVFSENRAGWVIADLGIQAARGITVPIYSTNTAEQAAYAINHSGARIVFVSNRVQYQKLLRIRDSIPGVEQVFSFERFIGEKSLPVMSLYQLSEVSYPLTEEEWSAIDDDIEAIVPDDLLTIIYTSGTTGVPKGVMLTHGNILFNALSGVEKLGGLKPGEIFLSFLPLSHILERTAGYYAVLMHGCHIAFAESVEKVVENIQEVRPTIMVSVPRLFEKIHSRIYENVHQMSVVKRRLFQWAVAVGREYVHCRYERNEKVGLKKLKYVLADRLVFAKIRQRFGGRMRFFISGGAPLDKSINEFMWIIGIPTFEGYGLTETSPALTINAPGALRFGSVGTVLPQTEVRLDVDGELLVRGPQVMSGYYLSPEATEESFSNGWLRTGDIAKIDADGFVYIVDRKKELIVTAGGKNIAPQPLENELKLDKYISQAFVFGDRKPFLIALITPNTERLLEFAHHERLDFFDLDDLAAHERVKRLYQDRVALLNARLASYETIKKVEVLPREFSIEGGELTPTLKLRRKIIYEKYRERIEGLYSDLAVSTETSNNGGLS